MNYFLRNQKLNLNIFLSLFFLLFINHCALINCKDEIINNDDNELTQNNIQANHIRQNEDATKKQILQTIQQELETNENGEIHSAMLGNSKEQTKTNEANDVNREVALLSTESIPSHQDTTINNQTQNQQSYGKKSSRYWIRSILKSSFHPKLQPFDTNGKIFKQATNEDKDNRIQLQSQMIDKYSHDRPNQKYQPSPSLNPVNYHNISPQQNINTQQNKSSMDQSQVQAQLQVQLPVQLQHQLKNDQQQNVQSQQASQQDNTQKQQNENNQSWLNQTYQKIKDLLQTTPKNQTNDAIKNQQDQQERSNGQFQLNKSITSQQHKMKKLFEIYHNISAFNLTIQKQPQNEPAKRNYHKMQQIEMPFPFIHRTMLFFSHFVKVYLPASLYSFIAQQYHNWLQYVIYKAVPIFRSYYDLFKILNDPTKPKLKKVYYDINYANLYGGAKIIMKSSPKIKSINSILEDGTDKYMYTDQSLPLKIIIGLNQEIATDSIFIASYQMYSCITKQFKVEGKFTMEDKKWVHLGTFKAENIFGQQQFYTERKIIRYIKVTIMSAYGKWSYFTLTQIKIKGKNLFADALADKNSPSTHQGTLIDHEGAQSQSHKQEQERPPNMCLNQVFKLPSEQPHQNNLIASLIAKIDKLEAKNTGQSVQLYQMSAKISELTTILINKTQQNTFYKQLIQQYKSQSSINLYVIVLSLFLSSITLCSLVCLCLIRRKELIQIKKRGDKGPIKKSNSFD